MILIRLFAQVQLQIVVFIIPHKVNCIQYDMNMLRVMSDTWLRVSDNLNVKLSTAVNL